MLLNFILTDVKGRSMRLNLLFNNTSCLPKHKSTNCFIISTVYHAMLTLMVFKLLLCLSSPNFPSGFAVLFLT